MNIKAVFPCPTNKLSPIMRMTEFVSEDLENKLLLKSQRKTSINTNVNVGTYETKHKKNKVCVTCALIHKQYIIKIT